MSMHIILLSGGLASCEMGRRTVSKYGKEHCRALFFDTLIEDEDLYRFLLDCEQLLRIKIERIADGRTPWDVFRQERYIGNSRVAPCTKILKRQLLERILRTEFQNKNVVLHFGLEWWEKERLATVEKRWLKRGYKVEFPLLWTPLLDRDQVKQHIINLGLNPPRLYELGFRHNNCGGACVKAGIKQWTRLLKDFRERYLWHEIQEQQTRNLLHKDVAILRDRTSGVTKPLTLRDLRVRIEGSENYIP
ncbi:MAG: hypothetical protein ACYCZF_03740 [Anaerolineae bacterium]